MRDQGKPNSSEAARWLAEQVQWETRLDQLRRPGGLPRQTARRPRPTVPARRAS